MWLELFAEEQKGLKAPHPVGWPVESSMCCEREGHVLSLALRRGALPVLEAITVTFSMRELYL